MSDNRCSIILGIHLKNLEALKDLKSLMLSKQVGGVNVQYQSAGWSYSEYRGFVNGKEIYNASIDQDGGDIKLAFTDQHLQTWAVQWNNRETVQLQISVAGQTPVDFSSVASYSWHYGIALNFTDLMRKEIEKLNSQNDGMIIDAIESNEPRTFTVIVSAPLISSQEQWESLSPLFKRKIENLNGFVENYRKSNFIGNPLNSWKLVLYNATPSVTSNLSSIDLKSTLSQIQIYGQFEVRQENKVLYIIFHETSLVDQKLVIQCFQDFYKDHFDGITAKLWDKKDKIKPIKFLGS